MHIKFVHVFHLLNYACIADIWAYSLLLLLLCIRLPLWCDGACCAVPQPPLSTHGSNISVVNLMVWNGFLWRYVYFQELFLTRSFWQC